MSKDHLCLCPYCLSATIYFDNDYIPMNSSFIRLAMLYYQTDIPFADLVSALLSKVVVRSKPYKHYFVQVDISNDEFGDNREPVIDRKEEQYSYWENLKLKRKDVERRKHVGKFILPLLYLCRRRENFTSCIYFKFSLFPIRSEYRRYEFLTSSLEYLLRHYFTSITEIAMITKMMK